VRCVTCVLVLLNNKNNMLHMFDGVFGQLISQQPVLLMLLPDCIFAAKSEMRRR
jgi:hypothetical protein